MEKNLYQRQETIVLTSEVRKDQPRIILPKVVFKVDETGQMYFEEVLS